MYEYLQLVRMTGFHRQIREPSRYASNHGRFVMASIHLMGILRLFVLILKPVSPYIMKRNPAVTKARITTVVSVAGVCMSIGR